jgi:hypothetical protein
MGSLFFLLLFKLRDSSLQTGVLPLDPCPYLFLLFFDLLALIIFQIESHTFTRTQPLTTICLPTASSTTETTGTHHHIQLIC